MSLILNSNKAPHVQHQLWDWFTREWGEFTPLKPEHTHIDVPSPLVALNESGQLMGGLAFTVAPKPQNSEPAIWINALFVDQPYRRKGIASKLITAAEMTAAKMQISELFTYTEFASLYEGNCWITLESEGGNYVLVKQIS